MKFLSSKKTLLLGVILLPVFLLLILMGASLLSDGPEYTDSTVELTNSVQNITIKAGLGYSPNRISAKADVPTQLKVDTNNTYDCTAFINIPKLGIKEYLPPTGSTYFNIPPQAAGEEIEGYCGGDTYKFIIRFS